MSFAFRFFSALEVSSVLDNISSCELESGTKNGALFSGTSLLLLNVSKVNSPS